MEEGLHYYNNNNNNIYGYCCENVGCNNYNVGSENGLVLRKRVMVVVENTSHSKHAMIWALNHATNKGDLLTLLHIVSPNYYYYNNNNNNNNKNNGFGGERQIASYANSSPTSLVNSLGSLCKACKPEVEVEALVIQGPKLATVISQVKKLEVSVLVLGQKKPSLLINCLCGTSSSEDFVEDCINSIDQCFTVGVRKQSRNVGGYLITTRWRKNFWQLA